MRGARKGLSHSHLQYCATPPAPMPVTPWTGVVVQVVQPGGSRGHCLTRWGTPILSMSYPRRPPGSKLVRFVAMITGRRGLVASR